MIIQILITLISVDFAAGSGSTSHSQETQAINMAYNKQSSFPPRQGLLASFISKSLSQKSTENYQTSGNKLPPTSHYLKKTDIYHSESSGTIHYKSTPIQIQLKSEPHQVITDERQLTSEMFQINHGNHRTAGYLQMTSHQHQSRTDNLKTPPGKYKQTTVSKLFQAWNISESSKSFSNEYSQGDATTNKASFMEDLQITGVFLCNDGKFRIYSSGICDGQIDCPDGSDESPYLCNTFSTRSSTTKCAVNEFLCPSGKCITQDSISFLDTECWQGNNPDESKICSSPSWLCDNNTKCVPERHRCNGLWDCQDHTDEMISPFTFEASDHNFKCANGFCVSHRVLCNNYNDCGDNSDEISCDNHRATAKQSSDHVCTEYTCISGQCISTDKICNGDNDCEDGSDETACGDSIWIGSNNEGLIISISVLGGAILITIAAIACVTICYRRKYKTIRQRANRANSQPPPYWQVVSLYVPDPLDKDQLKTEGQAHAFGETTALPE